MKKTKKSLRLPVQIRDIEGIIITETEKISSSEVAFTVDRYIPENSIVGITMLLPMHEKEGKVNSKISCQGKVTSIEPTQEAGENKYAINLFLIGMSSDNKKMLEHVLKGPGPNVS